WRLKSIFSKKKKSKVQRPCSFLFVTTSIPRNNSFALLPPTHVLRSSNCGVREGGNSQLRTTPLSHDPHHLLPPEQNLAQLQNPARSNKETGEKKTSL